MGRTAAPAVIEPTISLDDMLTMTTDEAHAALVDFCATNGFGAKVQTGAFDLFRRAAASPGQTVIVPTDVSANHTMRVHDCMQAITDSTLASGLAERAFDAQPGTHFEHDIRDDACQLRNVCTNAA